MLLELLPLRSSMCVDLLKTFSAFEPGFVFFRERTLWFESGLGGVYTLQGMGAV